MGGAIQVADAELPQPVTASIDWCEANYSTSIYWVAEFWNVFSNIPFIALASYAAFRTRIEGLELRHTITYILVVVVGLGSFAFHATLRHGWQLADELPMLAVVAHNLYVVSETGPKGKPKGGKLLPLALFLAFLVPSLPRLPVRTLLPASAVSVLRFTRSQVAYGTLLALGVARTTILLRRGFGTSHQAQQQSRNAGRLLFVGLLHSALAFLAWNIDNWFCDQLEPYKGALGHPWNGILEGHAIWHILCATGAVYMLSGCQLAALCARYSADYVEVRYSIGLPWLQRKGVSVSKQD